jgi:hypothetical protein
MFHVIGHRHLHIASVSIPLKPELSFTGGKKRHVTLLQSFAGNESSIKNRPRIPACSKLPCSFWLLSDTTPPGNLRQRSPDLFKAYNAFSQALTLKIPRSADSVIIFLHSVNLLVFMTEAPNTFLVHTALSAKARFRFQVSPRRFVVDEVALGQVFIRVLRCQYHSTNADRIGHRTLFNLVNNDGSHTYVSWSPICHTEVRGTRCVSTQMKRFV